MIMLYLNYLAPIIINLLFLPLLWWSGESIVTIAVATINVVFIPIYLLIVTNIIAKKLSIYRFIIFLLLMIVSAFFGTLTNYFNWGITTGHLLNPDSETLLILKVQFIISVGVILVGWIAISICKLIKMFIHKLKR